MRLFYIIFGVFLTLSLHIKKSFIKIILSRTVLDKIMILVIWGGYWFFATHFIKGTLLSITGTLASYPILKVLKNWCKYTNFAHILIILVQRLTFLPLARGWFYKWLCVLKTRLRKDVRKSHARIEALKKSKHLLEEAKKNKESKHTIKMLTEEHNKHKPGGSIEMDIYSIIVHYGLFLLLLHDTNGNVAVLLPLLLAYLWKNFLYGLNTITLIYLKVDSVIKKFLYIFIFLIFVGGTGIYFHYALSYQSSELDHIISKISLGQMFSYIVGNNFLGFLEQYTLMQMIFSWTFLQIIPFVILPLDIYKYYIQFITLFIRIMKKGIDPVKDINVWYFWLSIIFSAIVFFCKQDNAFITTMMIGKIIGSISILSLPIFYNRLVYKGKILYCIR